jgi:hypothetical protein
MASYYSKEANEFSCGACTFEQIGMEEVSILVLAPSFVVESPPSFTASFSWGSVSDAKSN